MRGETLKEFGDVILPEGQMTQAFVVLFPPATGEKGQQRAEAEALSALGYGSLLYLPPYLRNRDLGGPGDLPGEISKWMQAKEEFSEILGLISSSYSLSSHKIAIIGKNLGGSVGSFAGADQVGCFVATGCVPELSHFWVHSDHPVAKRFRDGFTEKQLAVYQAETRRFDLTESLNQRSGESLVQFGEQDHWIESAQAKKLTELLAGRVQIEWTEDDHEMNSKISIQNRFNFLKERLSVGS